MNKEFFKFRPHPWHGVSTGNNPPYFVTAFIEITPADSIKYEIDKLTGYLKVDRPQTGSALPPALYGFIPQTFCGNAVAALTQGKAKKGDQDPLDICVLSERPITKSEVLVPARVIGGLRMIDKGEADDKIIAVLDNDLFWKDVNELSEMPEILRTRLEHYFLTYKLIPGQSQKTVQIHKSYGKEFAAKVIKASMLDYANEFPR